MKEDRYSSMGDEIKSRMRKNDYYEILDLERECSLEDIKKSYKKLALRFHPDKNTSEGAKQVFNKIKSAYNHLSDSSSKAQYDQKSRKRGFKSAFEPKFSTGFDTKSNYYPFGSQERFKNYGNFFKAEKEREREQQERKRRQFEQKTEEMERQFAKLFSKIFQNSRNFNERQSNKRQKSRQFQKNQEKEYIQKMKKQYQEEKRAEERRQRLQRQEKNKKYLLIFFVALFVSILLGPYLLDALRSKPLFSFARTSQYRFEKKTELLQFSYFVNQKYFGPQVSQQLKLKVDETIDRKYLLNLKKQCIIARSQKKAFEDKAFKQKIGKMRSFYLQKSNSIDYQTCNLLVKLTIQHPNYIKALLK